jgi:small conductance mechanosensitive channel
MGNLSTVVEFGIKILVIAGLAGLGLVVLGLLSRRVLRAVRSAEAERERQMQMETLIQVAQWVIRVVILGVAVLMILSYFVDIAPLLASAGVAGLAISLGAQTLIKDFIAGFLILLEGQYGVGDVVKVASVSGVVERLTLRATYVRDINGNLHVVPNGEARIVSNVTKDWSRAVVDIGVAYEADLDHALNVLTDVVDAFAAEPEFAADLIEEPTVLGPLTLGDWAISVRVMVKTQPGKQWGVARELRKRILAACDREGITLPYPRQEVLIRNPDQAN